jgi:1-acyl-sn-glycerol-3-phosphate acyltransferase
MLRFMHPEGARTLDGKIHRFKRGFLYILRQSSLDLLPITLNGLYKLKPVKRLYLDPDAELEMVIHTPINNSVARQMTDEALLTTVHSLINSVYQP